KCPRTGGDAFDAGRRLDTYFIGSPRYATRSPPALDCEACACIAPPGMTRALSQRNHSTERLARLSAAAPGSALWLRHVNSALRVHEAGLRSIVAQRVRQSTATLVSTRTAGAPRHPKHESRCRLFDVSSRHIGDDRQG